MSLGYRIRDVAVEPGLALAPMEGVTDLTFRRLIRSIGGCGLVHTEFIPARNLKLSIRQALDLAMFDADEHPIAIQIYGNDPEVMAEGARIVSDLGADILDLNSNTVMTRLFRARSKLKEYFTSEHKNATEKLEEPNTDG